MARYKYITIDLACGKGGLNPIENPLEVQVGPVRSDLTVAENIRTDGKLWTRAPGLGLPFDNDVAGAPSCVGGHDWRPTSSVQRQISAWDDGKVYREVSGDVDSTTLVSGLTFDYPVTFVDGGDLSGGDRELFLFGRGVAPKVLTADGTSMSGITNEAADWTSDKPSGAFYHDARIFAFGIKSELYVGSLSDQGDFTAADARVFSIQPSVGDEIVAGYSYLPTTCYIWKKPFGIVAVDTTNVTGFYLPSTVIRRDIGGAGPHCVAKRGSEIYFISSEGMLYSLNALRPDVDPVEADLTAQLNLTEFINQRVDKTRLEWCRLIYDEARKELRYIYTPKGATLNSECLIFDFRDLQSGVKVYIENFGEVYNGAWVYRDSDNEKSLLVAGEGGRIYQTGSLNKSIGGAIGYTSELRYPYTDYAWVDPQLGGLEKVLDWIEFDIIPTGDFTLNVDIFADGRLVSTQTVTLGNAPARFDTAEFDVDRFAGLNAETRRLKVGVRGKMIAFGLRIFNPNEDFKIVKIRQGIKPLGKV